MKLSHVDEKGNAKMVDVSNKINTKREAIAVGTVYMKPSTIELISQGGLPKGDVLLTAKIAGIMAAKHTHELIPMCHNIPIDSVAVELVVDSANSCINITATANCVWKTGIEMEALTAVSVAGLTVYDMCKAVDKTMVIGDIKIIKKTGGKSDYSKEEK